LYKKGKLMKQLNIQEIEDLLGWVDKFELSRQSKKLNRDFSDAGDTY